MNINTHNFLKMRRIEKIQQKVSFYDRILGRPSLKGISEMDRDV